MNNLTVSEMNRFLNEIFDLQKKILCNEFKIMNLEFELALKQQMLDAFNRVSVKGENDDS